MYFITTHLKSIFIVAERTGFEPAEGFDPFTDLANRRFRPLSHRSVRFAGEQILLY